MTDTERTKGATPEPREEGAEELPFVIGVSDGRTQRVVGRVMSRQLAQAMFLAVCQEYPTMSVRLMHGGKVLSERSGSGK